MSDDLTLYYHPLSSYCWKVLIALYENDIPFTPRIVQDEESAAELSDYWPLGKFPILVAGDAVIAETSVMIEWLDLNYPGAFVAIPDDPEKALAVRMMDRLFDSYIMTPMQKFVADRIRPEGANRDPYGVEEAGKLLATAYGLIEAEMAGCPWAAGGDFSMADCAAFPALYYANKVQPFGESHPALASYLDRLTARASIVRVLEQAKPYLHMFPEA